MNVDNSIIIKNLITVILVYETLNLDSLSCKILVLMLSMKIILALRNVSMIFGAVERAYLDALLDV